MNQRIILKVNNSKLKNTKKLGTQLQKVLERIHRVYSVTDDDFILEKFTEHDDNILKNQFTLVISFNCIENEDKENYLNMRI